MFKNKKASPSQEKLQAELIELYRKALSKGVGLDTLDQRISEIEERLRASEKIEDRELEKNEEAIRHSVPRVVRFGALMVPLFFVSVGLYLVGNAVYPIMSYYVKTAPQLNLANLTSPIPQDQVMDITPIVVAQAQSANAPVEVATAPQFIDTQLDYTNLSNWFDAQETTNLGGSQTAEQGTYTIDIPTINVENAEVVVGGTDLNKSLIAYPGTALPGEAGSPVIFGHSVLRQFYNPSEKNPRRYNSIFSTIMTLKRGDKIYVTRDGVRYTYVVEDKTEVKPTDVYILEQKYDVKEIKLVTCVPEGTYLRRGVVTARLVQGE